MWDVTYFDGGGWGDGWYCFNDDRCLKRHNVPEALRENYPDKGAAITMCDVLNMRDYGKLGDENAISL